jgi:hypothetical protein
VLPCEVRVTAETHPLFWRLLAASSFKRLSGVLYLVVVLPDGTPGTISAAATSVFGDVPAPQALGTVLSVEGVRRLRRLLVAAGAGRGGAVGR